MHKFIKLILLLSTMISFGCSTNNSKYDQSLYNVIHYMINLEINPSSESINGYVETTLIPNKDLKNIALDLNNQLKVEKVLVNDTGSNFKHNNDILLINPNEELIKDTHAKVTVFYGGKPKQSKNPPWDEGFVWSKDKDGNPWVGVTCQGLGPSVWLPCKNAIIDEPDSVDLKITVPAGLFCAANGILLEETHQNDISTFHWKTRYPTNNYNISINVGNYETVATKYKGEMDLVYYVLPEERYGAEMLLDEATEMLEFYEKYFGPYPYRKEKFGLVQTKYWGMEHQTINSYGNHYKKTKLGYDFLMLHEMGHEWWGNLVSVDSWVDAWIHEGIGTYAEGLWIEDQYGFDEYLNFFKGRISKYINNESPVVPEEAAKDGSFTGDMYYKGAHIMHTFRYLVGKDVLLSILNETLYRPKKRPYNHINTQEFIDIAEEISGRELLWFFNAYLYKRNIPILSVDTKNNGSMDIVTVYWKDEGFTLPLEAQWKNGNEIIKQEKLNLSNNPIRVSVPKGQELIWDPNGWVLFELKD